MRFRDHHERRILFLVHEDNRLLRGLERSREAEFIALVFCAGLVDPVDRSHCDRGLLEHAGIRLAIGRFAGAVF